MKEQWLKFVAQMNEKGIPLPTLRDPKTKEGSVTLTLLFISSCILIVALLNSFANIFKGVDTNNAIEFFLISYGGYLGRKMQTKNGSSVENIESSKKASEQSDS